VASTARGRREHHGRRHGKHRGQCG
jgi:hypothetical protein